MYSAREFLVNPRDNIFGGITAAIVALPLALAFGISSGAGPEAGLYGAIFVGFFAAIFGGTPSQVSGPTGPMTVVMTAMTAEYIAEFPEQGLALAFTTVILGGCLQILIGILRLGKYIIMVPYPVISGFMTGIGVIIILLELGPLMGFSGGGSIIEAIASLPGQITAFNSQALIIGLLTLVIIFSWRGRLNRILPAPLLALIVATAALWLLFPSSTIERIGHIPSGFPAFHMPHFELSMIQTMLVNGIMLAVLGAIDSLLTSLVADNVTGTQHDSDRELIGQGIGNTLAGFFGGLPGAGATMRTMVNIRAGGSGPLSGATHALVLLLIAMGLGFLFESIPLAALAGILIKVGIDIIDWPFLKRLHRLPVFPVMLMIVVLLLTVFVDLITAVFVGVFVKNLVTISKLSDLQLGSVVLSDGNRDADLLNEHERALLSARAGDALLLRITGPVSYAVGRGLNRRFKTYNNVKLLLVDLSQANIIGISTAMVLEELISKAQASGVTLKVIGVHRSAQQELQQLDLASLVGVENYIPTLEQALQ